MRIVKTLTMSPGNVIMPAGWADGLDLVLVAKLAESMAKGILVTPIRVDRKHKLTYGRHRVSAAKLAGVDLRAEVVVYDDADEQARDALGENAQRTHMAYEERAKVEPLPAERGELYEDRRKADGKPPRKPRKKSATGGALVVSAPSVGSPLPPAEAESGGAISPAMDPGAHATQEANASQVVPPPAPGATGGLFPFDTLGIELPAAFADEVGDLQSAASNVALAVATLKRALTALDKCMDARPALAARWKVRLWQQQAQAIGEGIRVAMPRAVCAFCKLDVEAMPKCAGCGGTGYATAAQVTATPDELREKVIYVGDKPRAPKRLNVVVEKVSVPSGAQEGNEAGTQGKPTSGPTSYGENGAAFVPADEEWSV